jgi:hypothetical protein
MHTNAFVCMYVHVCMCMCAKVYMHVHGCRHVYMCVCINAYVCMCVCVCVNLLEKRFKANTSPGITSLTEVSWKSDITHQSRLTLPDVLTQNHLQG